MVRRPNCWGRALFVLALSLLAVAPRTRAADISWRRPEGGTFSSAGSWFGGVPPGAGDIAHFGLSTPGPLGTVPPYTVSFSALASNIRLIVEDDSVVFDLNGRVYETTNAAIGMAIGTVAGTTGQLTVTDGIVTLPFQSDLEIASTAGGGGSLVVGAGGKVLGTMDLLVGLNGAGALLINNNGDLIADAATLGKNAGSTGTATITGGGSSLLAGNLTVGAAGNGVLNVTGGGRVDNTDGTIGDAVGSSGAVTVSGANSWWQMSHWLEVGVSGEGTLRIEADGTVRDQVALVNGSAVVTGGSTWINDEVLNIGRSSTIAGELTIESGSQVKSGNSNLAIGSGKGTAIVRDGGTTWINANALNVGLVGEGDLTIESGAAVTSVGGGVAVTGGSTGTAKITGSSSTWTTSGDFVVGEAGVGQLDVNSGKLLLTNESDLIVGDRGSGQMTINSGGQALDAFHTVVGNLAGSSGELTVTGPGSLLRTVDRLTVGSGGSGTLLISNGGRVTNDVGIVSGLNSSVRVQGINSTWANGSVLNLFNNAALVIEDGGTVVSVGSDISVSTNGTAVVTVNNATWSNSSYLNVGSGGVGRLSIEAGGHVSNASATIGAFSSSTGSATVAGAGSTWTISGDLHVGNNGVNDQGVGTLRIQPGGTVDVAGKTTLHQGDAAILEGGTLNTNEIDFVQGLGAFQWTGGTLRLVRYDGNLLVPSGGVFAPGVANVFSPSVNIDGIYTQQAGAKLEIDFIPVAGIVRSDLIVVSDSAVVGGTLELKRVDGAVPDPATNYTIFDALSIGGSFANVAKGQRLATVDGFGSFLVNYGSGSPFDPTQIVLSSFIPNIPGDFDHDGDVDGNDFLVWQRGGSPNPNSDSDLTAWRNNFGAPALAATAAVPEPGTLVLTLWGLLVVGGSLESLEGTVS